MIQAALVRQITKFESQRLQIALYSIPHRRGRHTVLQIIKHCGSLSDQSDSQLTPQVQHTKKNGGGQQKGAGRRAAKAKGSADTETDVSH